MILCASLSLRATHWLAFDGLCWCASSAVPRGYADAVLSVGVLVLVAADNYFLPVTNLLRREIGQRSKYCGHLTSVFTSFAELQQSGLLNSRSITTTTDAAISNFEECSIVDFRLGRKVLQGIRG